MIKHSLFGSVEIEGFRSIPSHPFDPPQIKYKSDGITLSNLTWDVSNKRYLRAALGLAIDGAYRKKLLQHSTKLDLLDAIINRLALENLRLLDTLASVDLEFSSYEASAELLAKATCRQIKFI